MRSVVEDPGPWFTVKEAAEMTGWNWQVLQRACRSKAVECKAMTSARGRVSRYKLSARQINAINRRGLQLAVN